MMPIRNPSVRRLRLGATCCLSFLLCTATWAASPTLVEDFEQPVPSWRVEGGEQPCLVVDHSRTGKAARTGKSGEEIRITAGEGGSILLAHQIGGFAVIEEFSAAVWVHADRPGIQLLARVIVPRSIDPLTGTPVAAFVYGDAYQTPGRWHRLALEEVTREVQRSARRLATRFGPHVDPRQPRIDPREAVVSHLLLRIRPGAGPCRTSIDDLAVHGHRAESDNSPSTATWQSRSGQFAKRPSPAQDGGSPALWMPRIVDYQGEPLAELRSRGFNAILVSRPPHEALLQSAQAAAMRVVSPPPASSRSGSPLLWDADIVAAWHVGDHLTGQQLPRVEQLVRQLRKRDPGGAQRIVGGVDSHFAQYSRLLDVVVLSEEVPQATGSPSRASSSGESGGPLPGTPVWIRVETGQSERRALTAMAEGAEGVVFTSRTPLSSGDAATVARATSMELANLELQLLEPLLLRRTVRYDWSRAADRSAGLPSLRCGATTLVPLRLADADSPRQGQELLVRAVQETCQAYALSLGVLRPAKTRPSPQGCVVTLPQGPPWRWLVLTSDPRVISRLTAKIHANLRRVAPLEAMRLEAALAATESFNGPPLRTSRLETARRLLVDSKSRLAQEDFQAAYWRARQGRDLLAATTRVGSSAGVANPLTPPQRWAGQMVDGRPLR